MTNPLPPSAAVRKQKKKYFRGYFQFSIITIQKKYHPPGNLKLNQLGNFRSLNLLISMEKFFPFLLSQTLQILWAVMG